MLTKAEIRAAIEKVLRQAQAAGGHACPELTDATKPIGDLDDFDSLTAIEGKALLEKELGCTLGDDPPFISASGKKRALSIAEEVDRIQEIIAGTRAA